MGFRLKLLVLMYIIISYRFQRYVLIFHFWIVASQKTRLFLIFFETKRHNPFKIKFLKKFIYYLCYILLPLLLPPFNFMSYNLQVFCVTYGGYSGFNRYLFRWSEQKKSQKSCESSKYTSQYILHPKGEKSMNQLTAFCFWSYVCW